jgi:hypothetical protein
MWGGAAAAMALLALSSDVAAQTEPAYRLATRFGELSVRKDEILRFAERPLEPQLRGGNGLYLGDPFAIGAADVVLVTAIGGTACPDLYAFVTVTKSGARATRQFGTCSVALSISRAGASIRVTMRGYRGPSEPEAQRRKAAATTHVFVYLDGAVTEEVPAS